jgi:hypothetical protein
MLTWESESLLNLSMAQRDWMGSIIFSLELQASANLQACGCYNDNTRKIFYILYKLSCFLCTGVQTPKQRHTFLYFFIFFWRARVCWSLLCLCRPIMIFEGCPKSNSECCRSKRARIVALQDPAKKQIGSWWTRIINTVKCTLLGSVTGY